MTLGRGLAATIGVVGGLLTITVLWATFSTNPGRSTAVATTASASPDGLIHWVLPPPDPAVMTNVGAPAGNGVDRLGATSSSGDGGATSGTIPQEWVGEDPRDENPSDPAASIPDDTVLGTETTPPGSVVPESALPEFTDPALTPSSTGESQPPTAGDPDDATPTVGAVRVGAVGAIALVSAITGPATTTPPGTTPPGTTSVTTIVRAVLPDGSVSAARVIVADLDGFALLRLADDTRGFGFTIGPRTAPGQSIHLAGGASRVVTRHEGIRLVVDGTERPCDEIGSPVTDDVGRLVGVCDSDGTIRDVDAVRALQQALVDLVD